MSDIFSLKTIPITPELGMAFKNFRIEHEITAKAIITEFSKTSTYITKLEKGEIKKIEGKFFVELCNFITKTDSGLKTFLSKVGRSYSEYSHETKLIIQNIDDLLVEHPISLGFIADVNTYMQNHDISLEQLVAKINANEDILAHPAFNISPANEWFNTNIDGDISFSIIRLDIPTTYVENFLNSNLNSIHYVIAEAILYALYRLGNEEDAHTLANSKLRINNITHCVGSNAIKISDDNMDSLFGGLHPETSETLHDIASSLKLVINLTKEDGYGSTRIQQINSNLHGDLGFSFAYMSLDLENIISKSKEQKREFLKELKMLIEKYSQTETGLDIYD